MGLYKFENLKILVDKLAPQINEIKRKNLIVTGEDFTHLHNSGKTVFREDGIYVEIDGILLKRYIYLKEYNVDAYGLPKFHLIACSRVNEIGRNHYLSASSDTVNIVNKTTKKLLLNQKLVLCNYCRNEIAAERIPQDTKAFFDSLEKILPEEVKPSDLRPDGYVWNWDIISEIHRREKNYTCQNPNCKIHIEDVFDKMYIEVHHVNKNKKDNRSQNLEVLCKLCHLFVDEHHITLLKQNKRLRNRLDFFVEKYAVKLSKNSNLEKYDNLKNNIKISDAAKIISDLWK